MDRGRHHILADRLGVAEAGTGQPVSELIIPPRLILYYAQGVTSPTLPTPDVEFDDPLSELEDRRSSPPSYEIATYPADFTLEVLHSKWESGEIRIPPFQRGVCLESESSK